MVRSLGRGRWLIACGVLAACASALRADLPTSAEVDRCHLAGETLRKAACYEWCGWFEWAAMHYGLVRRHCAGTELGDLAEVKMRQLLRNRYESLRQGMSGAATDFAVCRPEGPNARDACDWMEGCWGRHGGDDRVLKWRGAKPRWEQRLLPTVADDCAAPVRIPGHDGLWTGAEMVTDRSLLFRQTDAPSSDIGFGELCCAVSRTLRYRDAENEGSFDRITAFRWQGSDPTEIPVTDLPDEWLLEPSDAKEPTEEPREEFGQPRCTLFGFGLASEAELLGQVELQFQDGPPIWSPAWFDRARPADQEDLFRATVLSELPEVVRMAVEPPRSSAGDSEIDWDEMFRGFGYSPCF